MAEWEPQGENVKDRLMDVVQRYMASTVGQAQGMERMMAQQAAGRVYPRIEHMVRGSTDENLIIELEKIRAMLKQVIGDKPADGDNAPKARRKGKGKSAIAGAGKPGRKTAGSRKIGQKART